MRRLLTVLVTLALGYTAGALLGFFGVDLLSGNTHDRSVEAAMTAAFVTGPAGALAAGLWAALRRTRTPRTRGGENETGSP
jgi:hypothetical protein